MNFISKELSSHGHPVLSFGVRQAMVLDAPDSLQVVSLEDAKVAKKDRVVVSVVMN